MSAREKREVMEWITFAEEQPQLQESVVWSENALNEPLRRLG
jgi:hypothetical protein